MKADARPFPPGRVRRSLRRVDTDELHVRYRDGDPHRDVIREELVERYAPFIHSIARRFAYRGEPFEDLTQVAWCAALRALDAYEPDLGYAFHAYVSRCVRGELMRHFRDKAWAVRIPRGLLELYLTARSTSERLRSELGRAPTIEEVADEVGASSDKIAEAMEVGHAYRASSLDAPRRPGDDRTRDVAIDEPAYDTVDEALTANAVLAPLLDSLDAGDADLVVDYYVAGRRQVDLATERGMSQVTVSRHLARAMRDLRRHPTVAAITAG